MKITTHQYAYGPHPSQTVRLILPGGAHIPVAVVIHGGYWRSAYGAELAEPLGRDLTRFGVAPRSSSTAGWARAAAGRPRWPTSPGRSIRWPGRASTWPRDVCCWTGWPPSVIPPAASSPPGSPIADRCGPARPARSGPGEIARPGGRRGHPGRACWTWCRRPTNGWVTAPSIALMEGEPRSLPQRYHHASPLASVGDGARVVCVHGDADDTVPLSQSERYVEAALRAGDPAKLIVLPGIGHFELIDVRHPAWAVCRDQVLRMV